MRSLVHRSSLLLIMLLVAQIFAEVHGAPVRSKRGVQHKDPLISDDFVVACIMIMFLLLFCFGKQ